MFFIFMFIFCTIWWPWNNFTWFSNGYDTEDMQFKFASFVQMIGVSTIAASINNAFHDNNFTLMSIGFVIMRIPQILLWFKVAYDDKSSRELALRS